MVIDIKIHNVLRRLERYFISLNDFKLNGRSYDLLLLLPADSGYTTKYTWIISSKYLDDKPQKKVIHELLEDFRSALSKEDFASVSRISIINSNAPTVKNLNFMFPYRSEIIEISNNSIGGVEFENAFILHSRLLDKLREGNAVTIQNREGDFINAGIISIDNQYRIKFYTGKGLRELFGRDRMDRENIKLVEKDRKSDDYLAENNLIDFIKFDDIFQIE